MTHKAFPIRIFVLVPEFGFSSRGPDFHPHLLLMRNLPARAFAWHSGGRNPYIMREHVAVYFRSIEDAAQFLLAVPVELADGTRSQIYPSTAR